MKKQHQILFLCIFLFIIYLVPVVQTVYEYRQNDGHRIQILDLPADIFVTPMKNANADAALIDVLCAVVDSLSLEASSVPATAGDTSRTWDPAQSIRLIDEAMIKVRLLKQHTVDYNRHIMGAANKGAAKDTLLPYYSSLRNLQAALESALTTAQQGAENDLQALIAGIKSEASTAKTAFGGRKGMGDYPALVLKALERTMIGADYLRPYEKEMEKSSVFANTIRPWWQLVYYAAYGDLGDKGVPGRDGWMFYRPDIEYLVKPYVFDDRSKIVDANDVPIRESIVDSIVSFKNQLSQRGIDLLLVIMPGKPSIYPDVLHRNLAPAEAGNVSHSRLMMEQLNRAGIETVDLFTAMAQERSRDTESGDSLYLRTDTHFKNRGLRTVARVVADRVKQYPWYEAGSTEYELDSLVVPRYGDVGEMTKLPASRIRQLKCSFPVENAMCHQVWRITRDEQGAVADRTLYKDDYQRSRILILGDSFSRIFQSDEPRSAGWISHLAYNLSQPVASIVNDGGASTLVRETLARKPQTLKNKKLVIWEIVERDFRFGAEGWKDIKIPL